MPKIIQADSPVFATFPWRETDGTGEWGPILAGSTKISLIITSPSREQYQKIYKWCVSKMGREFDKYGQPNEKWNVHLKVQTSSNLIYDSKGKNVYLGNQGPGSFHYGTVRFNMESHIAVELRLMEDTK